MSFDVKNIPIQDLGPLIVREVKMGCNGDARLVFSAELLGALAEVARGSLSQRVVVTGFGFKAETCRLEDGYTWERWTPFGSGAWPETTAVDTMVSAKGLTGDALTDGQQRARRALSPDWSKRGPHVVDVRQIPRAEAVAGLLSPRDRQWIMHHADLLDLLEVARVRGALVINNCGVKVQLRAPDSKEEFESWTPLGHRAIPVSDADWSLT